MAGKFSDKELNKMNHEELTTALSEAWSENDKDTFVSLFSPDGIIYHPMFVSAVKPSTLMDILSVNNKGKSIVINFKTLKDSSDGTKKIAFNSHETGSQVKTQRLEEGLIKMKAKIKNCRFAELRVQRFKIRNI